jgi:lysozyme
VATTNPYTYAYKGPPFNWLGHVSMTQWNAFQAWYTTAAPALGINASPTATPASTGSTSTNPAPSPSAGTTTPITPQSNSSTTNSTALAATIIKMFEGFSATAYPDPAGQTKTYSIGYGHEIVPGDGLSTSSTVTMDQANTLLMSDLSASINTVNNSVNPPTPLEPTQTAALVSLAYNIGGTAFKNSTLVADLNAGNTAAAAAQFNNWVYAGGTVNSSLVSRRTQEQALFSTGVILSNTGTPTVNTANAANSGGSMTAQLHYQIRAQQLRKTAGALEQYYQTLNDDQLAATFSKAAWQPPTTGYFQYAHRDDHLPMVAMGQIKVYLKDRLQRQDEGVFHMNYARNIIEKIEDKAQAQFDAKTQVPNLISQINGYFALPQYAPVLVNDLSDVYPAGSTTPRYRVHELDNPTTFELEQHGRALPGGPVDLKETPQPVTS